jgi:hypothetical protein
VQEVIDSGDFTIVVNGEPFEVGLAKALFLSSEVHQSIQCDASRGSFEMNTTEATAADFDRFLTFVGESSISSLDLESGLPLLSFCRLLGNDSLALVLLTLLHPIASIDLRWSTVPDETISRVIGICAADVDLMIDLCASLFHSYSAEELRVLDRRLLNRILESRFLTLRSEDSLLRLVLDLGDDFCELLNFVEISFLSESGISDFVDGMSFSNVTPFVWAKVCDRLKCLPRPTLSPHRFRVPCESRIFPALPSVLNQFRDQRWELLYRGSRDGFRLSNFHGKCDGHSNTVTMIETTTECIFGGFTPIGWDSSNSWKEDSAKQSFLFRIKDHRNSEPHAFPLSSSSYAICCNSSYGPTFGTGHNIHVADSCHQNKSSYTNLGKNYVNDTGLDGTQVFTGEQYFTVREIEVFSITG